MTNRSRGQTRRRTRPTTNTPEHTELDSYDDEGGEVIPASMVEDRREGRRQRTRPVSSRGKIKVDRVAHEPIIIEFVGEEYEIVPPRLDALMNMGKTANDTDPSVQLKVWLWDAFGEDGYNDVMDRIEDDGDEAGWDEVQDLIQAVTAYVGKSRRT